ncbi:Bug family tripartite tricarboxylate transporter substrate binding protein [Sabulicella glaciei]|uniref:Tripartite tricarboxylate transporter substrate binding protein n=1 Tax=Sabulicella glaciei TaxID=2984948 RepID=A0ABT3NXI0_9PROT|nr:tripartite tricarboxylate transporter substrate binding protein [Roseococcus sp. MDT2-1-1]MCW8086274.1 tripartite tricarboxylate transporter substrate binding protein [Roseococcus sp. MDT2-1-1]
MKMGMAGSRRGLLAASAAAFALPVRAQPGWPTRPVRLVVAFAAGGPADLVARIVAARLEPALGQPVVVENRAGAGGQIGTEYVARAQPDGQTLLFTSSAAHGVGPALNPNQPYDAVRDFTHVGLVASGPVALLVAANAPFRTLADFVAAGRATGRPVPFGSGGNGSLGHLTGELAARSLGLPMQHVPYRGSAPAQADLLAGTIAAVSDNLSAHAELVRTGSLRALAVASRARLPNFPDVPTYAEQGHPDLVAAAWFGVCGPAGLPAPVVERLNGALRTILSESAMRERLLGLGLQAEGGSSAAEYASFVAGEVARWREVVRVAGVTAG